MSLLTEIADYDEPGSWGRMSNGWPGVTGDDAYDMYVFANMSNSVPYGSYVLMSQKGRYGAKESYIRIHADYISKLKKDFKAAGKPDADTSVKKQKSLYKKYSCETKAKVLWLS